MPVWQASAARKHQHGERGAGAFAEPHAEIEQADAGRAPVAGADVPPRPTGDRRAHGRARRRGAWPSGATAAVQTKPSSSIGMRRCRAASARAEDGGKLASAEALRRCAADRRGCASCRARPASIAARLRSRPRRRRRCRCPAKRAPPPPNSAAAIADGRGGIADAHLAQHHEIGLGRERVVAGRHGVEELGLVHGRALG